MQHTYYQRSNWSSLQGGSGVAARLADNFSVLPPDPSVDRSIRCELRDGDMAPWDSSLEAAQVQGSSADQPINTTRWYSYWIRYEQVAPYSSLDFHISNEAHTTGSAVSCAWAENVTTAQRQLRYTYSGYNHQWPTDARTGLDLGNWHYHRLHARNSTGGDGLYRFYRDAALLHSYNGATSADGASWYSKIGWYRWATINGTDVCYIAKWQVTDYDPGYPSQTGTTYNRTAKGIIVPRAVGRDAATHVERGRGLVVPAARAPQVSGRGGTVHSETGTARTGRVQGGVHDKTGRAVGGSRYRGLG